MEVIDLSAFMCTLLLVLFFVVLVAEVQGSLCQDVSRVLFVALACGMRLYPLGRTGARLFCNAWWMLRFLPGAIAKSFFKMKENHLGE